MIVKVKYIILFFLAATLSSWGQQQFEREFSIGLNSGLIGSTVSFIPEVDDTYRWGYNGGITARYISEKHFGLQAELNFSQRGWKEKDIKDEDGEKTSNQYSKSLGYIELPVLTHLYFGRKFRFIVNLGPKVSYMLFENKDANFNTGRRMQYGNTNRRFDYGLCGGGGFEFRSKSLSYILEGRYNFSLSDVFSTGRSDDFMRAANRNISVNLVILYDLGR